MTIRHGVPCGLRIEMRASERDGKAVLFHAPKGHWYDATGLWGGVWHGFSLRSTTAVFVYLTHSPVVIQFENALLRPRAACRARTRATPPKQGGHAAPVLAVKGTLRRFAPLTAPGRSEGMTVYEGKGGSGSDSDFVSHLISFDSTASRPKAEHSGRVDGPKGNLSGIPDALSRSRGALSPAGP